ncbi:MAG: SPOR domain-containing protein [Paludibacteraceae bacterium]|nr:SPOR domain-containing protein [Paludibacteraceae bacterium]
MKRLLILISVVFALPVLHAEDTLMAAVDTTSIQTDTLAKDSVLPRVIPNLLDSMPGVEVLQDSAVARLLQAAVEGGEEWIEITGYRVQVYSSNQQQKAKAEALRLEERLKDQLSQTVYVQYVPPFWKVRIGDFRTYDEARIYKKEVVNLFPSLLGDTYIVRDQIKVLK